MMYLILGLAALYLTLLLTIYYVPLRRAIDLYPDVPESAASVPDERQRERQPESAGTREVGAA